MVCLDQKDSHNLKVWLKSDSTCVILQPNSFVSRLSHVEHVAPTHFTDFGNCFRTKQELHSLLCTYQAEVW